MVPERNVGAFCLPGVDPASEWRLHNEKAGGDGVPADTLTSLFVSINIWKSCV